MRTPVNPAESRQHPWPPIGRNLSQLRKQADLTQEELAARLYPQELRVGPAPLIARPDWLPAEPVELGSVVLERADGQQPVAVKGTEPEAYGVLPLRAPGRAYKRYTSAVRYLGPPALFENRLSYRADPPEAAVRCGGVLAALAGP